MKLLTVLQILAISMSICKSDHQHRGNGTVHGGDFEVREKSEGAEYFDESEEHDKGNDLDFDYDDGKDSLGADAGNGEIAEKQMQELLLKAMRKPIIRKQIGEVVPILRVMSPAQRLTLAALVSSQIMSQTAPSESNLSEIAGMFGGKNAKTTDDRHNITEHLLLPISMDIANMFRGLGKEVGRNLRHNVYAIRQNEAKVNRFRRRRVGKPVRRLPPPPINRRIDEADYYELLDDNVPEKMEPFVESLKQPGQEECDYFTKSLCLEVSNYPTEAIISSLMKNADIAKTFLTDFDIPLREGNAKRGKGPNGRMQRLERRQDGRRQDAKTEAEAAPSDTGGMCPSSVKYARPKRARTTSGLWKYIVNTGDYTQTLRLEICLKPQSPCSFLNNQLHSECTQVFNYHRLLTWDETKGLHMDVFKVPSCCSCHVQGYANFYPPNGDFSFADKRKEATDAPEFPPQKLPDGAPISTVGNKREVPKPIPIGSLQNSVPQTPIQYTTNVKEYFRDPVDHLVPPGPPLPLENEGSFGQPQESKYHPNKGSVEHNSRFPVATESTLIITKPTEPIQVQPSGSVISVPNTRVQSPVAMLQPRPNLLVPQTHHFAAAPPRVPHDTTDATAQIRYFLPAIDTPLPHQNFEFKKIVKPHDGGPFRPPLPPPIKNVTKHTFIKANQKQPVQPVRYHTEYNDVNSQPSRISPLYITPPKPKEEFTRPTTPVPKKSEIITASGHKKINYNYHPIIDFFTPDTKKMPTHSPQSYSPVASDWTPVL